MSLDFDVEVNLQGTYNGTLIISSQRIDLGEESTKVESFLKNKTCFQNDFDKILMI